MGGLEWGTTPDGYAMLMSPNKGETAVHGYHCPGDMVVRMRTVLAIPRGWYVCLSADKCWLEWGAWDCRERSKPCSISENAWLPPIFFLDSNRPC